LLHGGLVFGKGCHGDEHGWTLPAKGTADDLILRDRRSFGCTWVRIHGAEENPRDQGSVSESTRLPGSSQDQRRSRITWQAMARRSDVSTGLPRSRVGAVDRDGPCRHAQAAIAAQVCPTSRRSETFSPSR